MRLGATYLPYAVGEPWKERWIEDMRPAVIVTHNRSASFGVYDGERADFSGLKYIAELAHGLGARLLIKCAWICGRGGEHERYMDGIETAPTLHEQAGIEWIGPHTTGRYSPKRYPTPAAFEKYMDYVLSACEAAGLTDRDLIISLDNVPFQSVPFDRGDGGERPLTAAERMRLGTAWVQTMQRFAVKLRFEMGFRGDVTAHDFGYLWFLDCPIGSLMRGGDVLGSVFTLNSIEWYGTKKAGLLPPNWLEMAYKFEELNPAWTGGKLDPAIQSEKLHGLPLMFSEVNTTGAYNEDCPVFTHPERSHQWFSLNMATAAYRYGARYWVLWQTFGGHLALIRRCDDRPSGYVHGPFYHGLVRLAGCRF